MAHPKARISSEAEAELVPKNRGAPSRQDRGRLAEAAGELYRTTDPTGDVAPRATFGYIDAPYNAPRRTFGAGWFLEFQRVWEPCMGHVVERVHNISDREFRHEFADRGRPVIITGCIEHWPARQKWDLDYFNRRFGDKQVNFSGRQWRIAELVSELRGGVRPAPYLNQVKLDEQFRELVPDVGDLRYTRKNCLRWRHVLPRSHRIDRGIRAVFIGGAGSGFGKLHWDYSYLHVYISQVRGPKDFIIFAPEDSQYLYPNPEYMADSLIKNFNDFDIEKYPDVKKATPIRFTVHDGETVFLPGGWWHATKMHELSISVAESSLDRANWKTRADWFGASYHGGRHPRWKIAGYEAYMSMLGLMA